LNLPEEDVPLIALGSMSLGQKGTIVAFSFDTVEGERIQKMGLVPGENFEIVRQPAPAGSIEIKVRGYFVSLSKQEADHIKVKLLPSP
jgi:Fe2+ transport system protein FeoA